jgi:hypothetical protein
LSSALPPGRTPWRWVPDHTGARGGAGAGTVSCFAQPRRLLSREVELGATVREQELQAGRWLKGCGNDHAAFGACIQQMFGAYAGSIMPVGTCWQRGACATIMRGWRGGHRGVQRVGVLPPLQHVTLGSLGGGLVGMARERASLEDGVMGCGWAKQFAVCCCTAGACAGARGGGVPGWPPCLWHERAYRLHALVGLPRCMGSTWAGPFILCVRRSP